MCASQLIRRVVRTLSRASVASRLLLAGALAALAVQLPLLFTKSIVFPWFYIAPLIAVVAFLSALAWAAFPLSLPPTMSVAAAVAAAGYVILVSPSPLLTPGAEFAVCAMGAGSLVVLAYRIGRAIRLQGVRQGWLVGGAGIGGAVILGQAGGRRYATFVTSSAESVADSVGWASYISLVLAFAVALAVAGRVGLGQRAQREGPSRTTRA
jgi:hypothetical protein